MKRTTISRIWRAGKRRIVRILQRRTRIWRRRFSFNVGHAGEIAALRFLLACGYDILARNLRVGNGELDLIAFHRQTLVFVEVKTRSRHDGFAPQLAVDRAKEEQLQRLARAFCHRHGLDASPIRFDVIAVTLRADAPPRVEHFVGAF